MSANKDRDYLAKDVYRQWKHLVSGAEASICVFSPYLDRLVVDLMSHTDLESEDICVVTDLSPTSGVLSYRAQLLAIRALLNDGVEVRSLTRLHAKVLVVDGSSVTVGSQNFTRYARLSRETTVVPAQSMTGSTFLATLAVWRSESELVDLAFVEQLLEALDTEIKQLEAAKKRLADAYGAQHASYETQKLVLERERIKRENVARRTAQGIAQSRLRVASRSLFAKLEWEPERDTWGGSSGGYFTLRPQHRTSTFASWLMVGHSNQSRRVNLAAKNMYPMLFGATGRMAFVRVNQGQISYFRAGVSSTDAMMIGDAELQISVGLPSIDLDVANVEIELRMPGGDAVHKVRLRFDGGSVEVVDHGAVSGRSALEAMLLATRATRVLETSDGARELLAAALSSFKFAELGIRNLNAGQYLKPEQWYRVELIEFSGRPVLAVTEHR